MFLLSFFLDRAPAVDTIFPSGTGTAGSDQVILRHTKGLAYRCSLPGLAGFTSFCCVEPNPQRRFPRSDPEKLNLGREFNPAGADCRYRAPLTPRLARSSLKFPGGERGIRTLEAGLSQPTRFPVVRLQPTQPSLHRVAEREGFEPPKRSVSPLTRFRVERFQPLSHLSFAFP